MMIPVSRLQLAVISGNKERILELLQENFDVTSTDDQGDSLLHDVFQNKSLSQQEVIEILEIFLDRGADINVQNKNEKTILHLAVERRMKIVIDFCLRRNANLNVKAKNGDTIAHFLIKDIYKKYLESMLGDAIVYHNSSCRFVDWMVSRGFDFFQLENITRSPLYLAINLNLQFLLLILLKRIVYYTDGARKRQTDLLRAFWNSQIHNQQLDMKYGTLQRIPHYHYNSRYLYDIVKFILEQTDFIDDSVLDMSLISAVSCTVEFNVLELLANRITNVNFRNKYGQTTVESFIVSCPYYYSEQQILHILRILMLKGADMKTIPPKLFRSRPTMTILRILKEIGTDFNLCFDDTNEKFINLVVQFGREAGMVNFIMNETSCDEDTMNKCLLLAIQSNNEFAAKELIEHGADLNYKDKNGGTLLHLSVEYPKMVEFCLKHGLDVNAKDNNGKTPCHLAMTLRTVQREVVRKLIEHGADLNYRDNCGKTLLHLAVNHLEIVELLLKHNLDVNAEDDSGKTPLALACKSSQTATLEILLKSGADFKWKDKDGKTLLHASVYNPKAAEFLLKNGADVNAEDTRGKTALVIACELGQRKVIEILLDHGADLKYRSKDGKTLLHIAVWYSNLIELLIKKNLNVNAQDNRGKTPLHYAMSEEVVTILLRCGAVLEVPDKDKHTPLYDALRRTTDIKFIENYIRNGARVLNPKVFELAVKRFEEPYSIYVPLKFRYLKKLVIRMVAVGLVAKIPYVRNGIGKELQNFLELCKAEVQLLKTYFINDYTTLYNFLHKSLKLRCDYVDNEKLMSFLTDKDNEKKFHNYFIFVQNSYHEAATRRRFLDKAAEVLIQLINMDVPDECIDEVFMYLNNIDLHNFIESYTIED